MNASAWFTKLLEVLRIVESQPAPRPRVVDEALSQHFDLDEYRRAHGGEAPFDAPHIDDDGTI